MLPECSSGYREDNPSLGPIVFFYNLVQAPGTLAGFRTHNTVLRGISARISRQDLRTAPRNEHQAWGWR